MANYDIFDEQYYLSQYGFVKDAVAQGLVKSGLEHFQKYGQAAGLTKISRYFDENTYLTGNPDIAAFVRPVNPNGSFASGLDHFIQFGYDEGGRRTQVSPEYNEDFYLKNNSELLPFIQNGTFKSGYQHFIKYGVKEGRFGTSFFEPEYLTENPNLVPFIDSGALKTGRDHYFQFGQFEVNRSATFVGTRSNDIITGVGVGNVELIGVEVGIDPNGNRQYESFGTNEFDVLIGSAGSDDFVLGVPATSGNTAPTPLYLGNGQATIRNFDVVNDFIQLQGSSLTNYNLVPVGGDLSIQTRFGDVLGVIEGGANLSLTVQGVLPNGTFLIG
ncbi:calcium-binding protein [Kamptonema sp. UHCC 0994]|uniref:calcium-binding protein n=1 Tax=Kamptonema sp. UHCC 0994 TaxID=3031329 RepID=UPI0023B9E7CA|nr:calcium-binding protein [Kamptonema sp. UHCC 0994]MDF0555590.1 calcium-binding protein [Kamptonema sp. UHCC 0994]